MINVAHLLIMTMVLFSFGALKASSLLAFCAPLQEVTTWITEVNSTFTAHFKVYDPSLQMWQEDSIESSGHFVVPIQENQGIVVIEEYDDSQFTWRFHVAVYSPVLKKWVKDSLIDFAAYDQIGTVDVHDGVVAVVMGEQDRSTLVVNEWAISYATYDPFQGRWIKKMEPVIKKMGVDFLPRPYMINADGIVAWDVWVHDIGDVYHSDVYYRFYDPVSGRWIGESLLDIPGEDCLGVGLEIENATLMIQCSETHVRGITKDRYWNSDPTKPQAIFHMSPPSGPPPLDVWFTNTSIGAWSTIWDFGDGQTSTLNSTMHTYQTHGTYNATLSVTNAYGEDTVFSSIEIEDTNLYFLDLDAVYPGGSVAITPNDGTFLYPAGTAVKLQAEAKKDWQFSYWIGDVTNATSSETSVIMDEDTTVIPVFEKRSINLQKGLVAEFLLNNDARDTSGNGNHGTLHGPLPSEDRLGNPTGAYSFDGQDDYITADADLLPQAERTVSLWFYADTVANRPVLLAYGGNRCGTSWFMGLNLSGSASFHMSSHCLFNAIEYYYDQEPVGHWYHYAVTTNADGTTVFVNGERQTSTLNFADNTVTANTDLSLGVSVNTQGKAPYTDINVGYFKGRIDDVRIYDRALSTLEIAALAADDASIVNVDARVNTHRNPNRLYFKAGRYTVTPVGTADNGYYNSWNPWGHGPYWTHRYWIDSTQFATISTHGNWHETDIEALEEAVSTAFTLQEDGYVDFYIGDSVYRDNTGGVSLHIGRDFTEPCFWDVSGDNEINLADMILCLQVVCGLKTEQELHLKSDWQPGKKISLSEILCGLQFFVQKK